MEKSLKKRKVITAILLALLVTVYVMIFFFSAESGEDSSDVSVKVTKWFIKIYYRIKNGLVENNDVLFVAVAETEGIIRKLAHFMEYMAVGFLSFEIALMWVPKTGKSFLLVTVQLVISAALDEIHQYFVPDRYASVKDVMIDTAGGITGILIILCIMGIGKLWKHIRQRK